MTAALPLRVPAAARTLPPVAPAVLGALRAAPGFLGRWSVRLLVAVAVLAFAVLAAGPHLLGYRTMTMRPRAWPRVSSPATSSSPPRWP